MTETKEAKVGSIKSRALADLQPNTVDTENATVNATLSTGEGRWLFDTWEELEPTGANLDALNDGASVVLDHKRSASHVVGRVVPGTAKVRENKVEAQLAFSEDTDAWPLIRDGFLDKISLGYRIDKVEETNNDDGTRTARVIGWTPMEVSLVAVPAERESRIRSHDAGQPDAGPDSDGPAARIHVANRARSEGFETLASRAANGVVSTQDARRELMNNIEERELQTMTTPHVRLGQEDAVTNCRNAAVDALVSRMTERDPETEAGAQMRGYSIAGMCRELFKQQNVAEASAESDQRIISRALHTTSDFPQLLGDATQKIVAQAYEQNQSPLRAIARNVDASDFKPFTRIQMGEHPQLEQVREHGEFKRGTFETQTEELQAKTFGKVTGISRQALVNDQTGGLTDFAMNTSTAATALEADLLAGVLVENSGSGRKMSDGETLFASAHDNVASTNAVTVDGLSEARQLLRTQRAPGGKNPLALSPSFLVVGSQDETEAEKVIAQIAPASVDASNPFSGRLTVATEPRLDPANSWYVFAAPSQSAVLALVFLDGQRTPEVQTRQGFDIDGLEIRIRHDVNAGLLDYRGGVRVPKA
jgi:phage head maturation protease/phage major head subunit gpT-like protein